MGVSRSLAVRTLSLAVLLLLGLLGGQAAAVDRWSDITDQQWLGDYGVTAGEVETVADGYPDGSFRPYQAVTRGQFAKMAVNGLDLDPVEPATPSFKDVPRSHVFYGFIEGAYAAGIAGGYDGGLYKPDNPVTRQQTNSILGRYLSSVELEVTGVIRGVNGIGYPSLQAWYDAQGWFYLPAFLDQGQVLAVHRPGTAYLIYRDVVKGSSGRLNPNASLTRAQAAVMVLRVLDAAGTITVAPPAPTNLATLPPSPASDGRPYVTGKTIGGGQVAVYDTFAGATTQVAQGTADSGGNFSVRVPLLAEGQHSFTAKVKNQAGLISAASAPVTYVFDPTAPTGSIVAPVDGAAVASRKPLFQVSAADAGAGVQSVTFQYRPAGSTAEFTTISVDGTPQQGLYEALWTDISLPDGAYEFRAWVTDRAGNQTLLGPTEVVVDLQVPTVELQLPSAEGIAFTESPTPPFIAGAADAGAGPGVAPSGVARVDFRYRLKSQLPAPPWTATDFTLLSSDDSPAYGANWGTTQLADGDYVFAVQAVDRAGNPSALATQEVIVDRAAPEVRGFGPAAGATLPDNTLYQLTWEILDVSPVETVKLEYSADGGTTWQLLAAAAPNTGSFPWNVPNVEADNPNFKVRLTATDAAGPAVGDIAGHTTQVVSPAFTVAEAPAPATGLVASDPDQSSAPPSLDGRDFHLEWTPSPSTDVAAQHIYLLPGGTPLDLDPGTVQVPVAGPLGATDSSWTGTAGITTDSLGVDLALGVDYVLYVVTEDSTGALVGSAGEPWPAAAAPAAPTGVTATDPDSTFAGVDGRDFQAAWTPSVTAAVVQQRIYILPADVSLVLTGGSAHTPVATLSGNTDSTWTGPDTLHVDSAGTSLAPGNYHVYVVAVDDDGRMSASAPAALTVADP